MLRRLFPFLAWPRPTRVSLRDDIVAGLIGAVIVLPQGVAFATLAGMPPQYGLYAALDPEICRNCKVRIFPECHAGPPAGPQGAPGG